MQSACKLANTAPSDSLGELEPADLDIAACAQLQPTFSNYGLNISHTVALRLLLMTPQRGAYAHKFFLITLFLAASAPGNLHQMQVSLQGCARSIRSRDSILRSAVP